MKTVNLSLSEKVKKELEKNYEESMKQEEFKNLVKNLKLEKSIVVKYTSKLSDTVDEKLKENN